MKSHTVQNTEQGKRESVNEDIEKRTCVLTSDLKWDDESTRRKGRRQSGGHQTPKAESENRTQVECNLDGIMSRKVCQKGEQEIQNENIVPERKL